MVDKTALGCSIFFMFMFMFMFMLIFVFMCAAVSAQDAVTLDSADLYATMRSVSVTALFGGDANANAAAHVEWRPRGAPAFSVGHPLVRLPGSRFVGSVLFLEPGTAYDVRVVADDPDNGAPVTLDASVTTRPIVRSLRPHDLAWNPSTIVQRTGRVDRLGCKAEGPHPIAVFLPYLAGTADEGQYRVMSDRERWFRVVMGLDEVARLITADSSAAIPLSDALSAELSFRFGLEDEKRGR